MTELAQAMIPNAKVQAFRHPTLGPPDAFCGGPVLDEVANSEKLRHYRWSHAADSAREGESYSINLAGNIAYAGPIISHFGHMVAECVHRIIPSRHFHGFNKFLFVSALGDERTTSYAELPTYNRSILSYLQIEPDNCTFISSNAIVENLAIVQQGAAIGTLSHKDYLDIMFDYSTQRLRQLHDEALPSKRVYVAGRSRGGGSILGAAYLENRLEQAGFWIFRPEDYSFSHQLYVYSNATQLVFSEGSAIHSASLLGREMMNEVSVVIRRPTAANNFRNELIGRAKSLRIALCSTYLGTVLKDRLTSAPWNHFGLSVYNVQALKSFFADLGCERFQSFERERYFSICEQDLLDYLRFCLTEQGLVIRDTSSFARLISHFELLKDSELN